MRSVKRFDLYKKVPRDLSEPSVSGAVVSCCTVTLALYLFLSELFAFSQYHWVSEMLIDESKTEEKMQINLNITFPALACELLSFDAQDVMGSHEVDAHGNLFKERLTSKGDSIGREPMQGSRYGANAGLTRHYSFGYDNSDVDRIKRMVNSGEGCRVDGFVKVNKVPGNLHLSTYSHSYLFGSLYNEAAINVTHILNHISFGFDSDITYVRNLGTGTVSPLDGIVQTVNELPPLPEGEPSPYGLYRDALPKVRLDSGIYEYYAKVVPTTYEPMGMPAISVFQFTASSNKIPNQQMPSLYLRYDFTPVTVRYRETRATVHSFVVEVCAVLGGIFTTAGLMDGAVHRVFVYLARKTRAGKVT